VFLLCGLKLESVDTDSPRLGQELPAIKRRYVLGMKFKFTLRKIHEINYFEAVTHPFAG
jgi:hypothetical protein